MASNGEAPASKRLRKEAGADGETQDFTPKNIMITGGAGFIASHIVIRLVKKYPNYKIVNFDKLDYCSSLKNLDEISQLRNYKFVKGNLLSADLIKYVLETEEIDTIIHAAAQTHVDNSFGNSFAFTENNVMGSHVLIEAAKNWSGLKRFIHVSTDEVYGSSYDNDPSRKEGDVLEPTNPYAATKAAAEQIVKSYYTSFKVPVIITRGNNVYGPHQYPEKVIPKFIRRLVNGMPCCMHGDGSNSRHFIYVTDVARAFDVIMHKGVTGETYNIGCDEEFTNLEVAEELVKAVCPTKDKKTMIEFGKDRPFNDVRYYLNFNKLLALGWKPEMSFKDGLKQTVEWYMSRDANWWECGTDSSLSAHPHAKGAHVEVKNTV